jgi:hypothetical protein
VSAENGDEREGGDPPCWAHLFDDAPCPNDDPDQRKAHPLSANSGPGVRDYNLGDRQPNQRAGHLPNDDPTPDSESLIAQPMPKKP